MVVCAQYVMDEIPLAALILIYEASAQTRPQMTGFAIEAKLIIALFLMSAVGHA